MVSMFDLTKGCELFVDANARATIFYILALSLNIFTIA